MTESKTHPHAENDKKREDEKREDLTFTDVDSLVTPNVLGGTFRDFPLKREFDSLNEKIDSLALSVKSLKLNSTQVALDSKLPTCLKSVECGNITEDVWKEINNIAELTAAVPAMKFFPGNVTEKAPSVLRCEPCFNLLQSRFSGLVKDNPIKYALRGIGKYASSLSSGLLIPSEKAECLISGGNMYWHQMKRSIKQHLGCIGNHSQLHFEALQYQTTMKKRKARGEKVTENLIRIALSVLKSKSAAKHFESQIASHVATGSDLGDFGHSRNHFNEILIAMNVWVDQRTASFLAKPMPSTGFPPHFFISADKSTPQRFTNQAIMICPIADGIRVAIPVNSPEVYSKELDAVPGTVSGANARQLAQQIVANIKQAFGSTPEFSLKASWQGTVCDGQYQAKEFKATMHSEIGVSVDKEFSEVIWDPSHWLNLAITDVRDDKIGSSSTFMKRVVNRAKNIHSMFQRGKMLSCATSIAQSKGLKLRMTQGNCATRFWSSQYRQFTNIIHGFEVYA